jgi:hypothetical protein
MRTNARQKLKRPLRSMKALDRVAEVYQIQPGHRRMQTAYLYSLFTGTSVKLGSTLRYPRPSMTHGWATIRWQLVRRRSREQDVLPKFRNGWTGLRARTEQIRQNRICQDGTSP